MVNLCAFVSLAAPAYFELSPRLRESLPIAANSAFYGPWAFGQDNACFDMAEFFSGHAAISLAMRALGFSVAVYDMAYEGMNNSMDLCSSTGFILALCIVLLIRKNGVVWFAVPCNSIGAFAAASHYGRSKDHPDGNEAAQPWNLIIRRSFLLAAVALERAIEPFFESPEQTLLFKTTFTSNLPNPDQFDRVSICLGAFGAATKKPISIFSRTNWLQGLGRLPCPAGLLQASRSYTKADGTPGFRSNSLTKLTQIYPWPFAWKVAEMFHDHTTLSKNCACLAAVTSVTLAHIALSRTQSRQLQEAALLATGVDELRVRWNLESMGVPLCNAMSDAADHGLHKLISISSTISPLGAPPLELHFRFGCRDLSFDSENLAQVANPTQQTGTLSRLCFHPHWGWRQRTAAANSPWRNCFGSCSC